MPIYTLNNVNYLYTVNSGIASVTTSPSASGNITILASFSVSSVTYNVTSIAQDALAFTNSPITGITIPSSITSLGTSCFAGSYALTSITTYANISSSQWSGSGFGAATGFQMTFDYAGTVPDDIAAGKGNLSAVTLGSSITGIGARSFDGCIFLTSITLPSSVTSIGVNAFRGTGLTSINIASSITSVGDGAFSDCSKLTNIVLNRYLSNFYNVFVGTNPTNLAITFNYSGVIPNDACSNKTRLKTVTFGTSITSIGEWAFWNCNSLTEVTIPISLTSIGNYAFNSVSNLLAVIFRGNSIPTIGTGNFSTSGNTAYYMPGASNTSRLSMFTFTKTIPLAPTVTGINGMALSFVQSPPDATITNYSYSSDGVNYTIFSPAQFTSPLTIPTTGLKFLSTYTYTIKAFNGITSDASNGISSQMKSIVPCFKDDTKILTDKGYVEIKDLRNGDLVETFEHGLKPITVIGKRTIHHQVSDDRLPDNLYKYTSATHSNVFEDLIITGRHAILVDELVSDKQKIDVINFYGGFLKTDKKYLLPCCLDDNASIYEISGEYTVYNLALQNDDEEMNYGIYANGLLAETATERYMKNKSKMELIE
jgi:hypothetical protein